MYALAQFLFGALFGAVLSRTRSGLGGGITTWTGLDAHSTALWSVFALLLGGIVVRTYARGPRLSALWGLPLGYAVHAFLGTASYGMPMWDVLLFMPLLVVLGLAAETKVDARLPQVSPSRSLAWGATRACWAMAPPERPALTAWCSCC